MERKQTVLIVDDVPDDIAVLEEILKRYYQVKAVTRGEEALGIALGASPPDLILLDIIMPDMDGFEVCRALRQDRGGAAIPVIFLTAKTMREDEKAGLELGAVDYIRKPVDPEIVRNRVKAHLEQKEEIFRISEMKFRRLFETAQDGIMLVDLETDSILDVNPAFAEIMGASQEAFFGKRLGDMEFLRAILAEREGMPEVLREKHVRFRDLPMDTMDGRQVYVEFMTKTYQANRREVMQLNVRDITDLVVAERERDKLAARLSHYLSTSPTITYSLAIRDGVASWEWISGNVREVLGYSSEEALAPEWWFRNVNALDRARVMGLVSELAKSGTAFREYRFARKDGDLVWLHDEMRLLSEGNRGVEIVGTLTDITERKAAEEEIRLKSSALDAAANAVVITDREGRVSWANRAFGELTGYSPEEALGRNPKELVWTGRQGAAFYRELWDTILSGKVWSGKLVNRRKSGELYDEEMTITPVLDDSLNISHFIAIKHDITEEEASKRRLEDALREKEVLLKEIHHRVNNNMQVIISLLNISTQEVEGPALLEKLSDVIHRIYAMAAIHEQFYRSGDMSRIDFVACLRRFVDRAAKEYPEMAGRIDVACASESVFLNVEEAIPAGLIVDELLTNALKHAFPPPRAVGRIAIFERLTEGGELAIEVRDDGAGIPEGGDEGKSGKLGMLLIETLASQVGATVSFSCDGGTVAILRLRIGG